MLLIVVSKDWDFIMILSLVVDVFNLAWMRHERARWQLVIESILAVSRALPCLVYMCSTCLFNKLECLM